VQCTPSCAGAPNRLFSLLFTSLYFFVIINIWCIGNVHLITGTFHLIMKSSPCQQNESQKNKSRTSLRQDEYLTMHHHHSFNHGLQIFEILKYSTPSKQGHPTPMLIGILFSCIGFFFFSPSFLRLQHPIHRTPIKSPCFDQFDGEERPLTFTASCLSRPR
jgi:hypothetical protein